MNTKTTILELPSESVILLRKCISRLLPPIAYDTVFSRLAIDGLSRRGEGDRARTAETSKTVSESQCLLLEPKGSGIQVRTKGRTETGLPIWIILTVPGAIEKEICIDPSFLWTDKSSTEKITIGDLRGTEIQTVSATQEAVRKRIRILPRADNETLSMLFTNSLPKVNTDSCLNIDFLRKLVPLVSIAEQPSWTTLCSLGASWKDEDVWLGLQGSCPERLLSPGACRLLAWAFANTEVSTVSMGENGGTIKTSEACFLCTREPSAYRAERILPELAKLVLKKTKEKTNKTKCFASKLSRSLSTGDGYLSKPAIGFDETISIGCYGGPEAVAVVGKSDRSLVLSPEGVTTEEYPEVLLSGSSITKVSRLLRIYGAGQKESETEFLKNDLGESIRLDDSLTITIPSPRGLRNTFSQRKASATIGTWKAPYSFIRSCAKALDCVRALSIPIQGEVLVTLGKRMSARIELPGTCVESYEETTNSIAGQIRIPLVEWSKAISVLKKTEATIAQFSLVRVVKGGLFLDVSIHKESQLVLLRIPYARNSFEEIPEEEKREWKVLENMSKIGTLLQVGSIPSKEAAVFPSEGMRMLHHGMVKDKELVISNRLIAISIQDCNWDGILPKSVPNLVTLLGKCEYSRSDKHHHFQVPGLHLSTLRVDEDEKLFPDVTRLMTLTTEVILKAVVSVPALLEHIRFDSKQWLWRKDGMFTSKYGDTGFGEVEIWKGPEVQCFPFVQSFIPALESIYALFPEEILITLEAVNGRLLFIGNKFKLLVLLSQHETPDKELVETLEKEII